MFEKRNFKVDDRVKITNLGGDTVIQGMYGSILGKSIEHVIDHYIVLLDKPIPSHKAITVPEVCLEPEHPNNGSTLEEFLEEDGNLESATKIAIDRIRSRS